MKNNKGILIIAIAVITLAVLTGGFTIFNQSKGKKTFAGDGYILKQSEEVNVTTAVNEQYFFSAGTPYKEKYQTLVSFKDSQGIKVELPTTEFIHYLDNSLGTFTKGVILNVEDVDSDQVNYYSVSKNTILLSNGDQYTMTSLGQPINMTEFVWKISDTDYMIVSPTVTLHLSQDNEITLEKYAQLKYIENGIVRITHKDGTWQTVSSDAFIYTTSGAEINLNGKSFMVNGEQSVCFDKMMINDESNIALDETEAPEINIPTFNVVNGKDGASGANGASGTNGADGEAGEEGEAAAEGAAGGFGTAGTSGEEGEEGGTGAEGIWGFNGKEGKDAVNQGQEGDVPVDLKSKPVVDVANFETAPNKVSMQMQLVDKDNSIISDNANELATYKVYDRATMKEVANGSGTLSNIAKNVTINGLKPDTEYVMLVDGQYVVSEEDGLDDIRTINFLTKIFKTDKLGLVLTKATATDSEIAVQVLNTNTNIESYNIAMYGINSDGTQYCMGYYPINGSEAGQQIVTRTFNDTNLAGMSTLPDVEADENGNLTHTMSSNTTYIFKVASVTINSELININETESITTLKKKPYYAVADLSGIISEQPLASKQPVLTPNLKDHSMIVTLDAPNDDDHGITKYIYELYKAGNSTPMQTAEAVKLDTVAFTLSQDEHGTGYYTVVKIQFNDNEKTIEYALTSATADITESQFPTVEFIYDTNVYDAVTGYLKITDASGLMPTTLNDNYPLMLSIVSDYDTIRSLPITEKVDTPEGMTGNSSTSYYRFGFDGLKSDTLYQLTLRGPVMTSTDYSNWDEMAGAANSLTLISTMKDTYLAGSTRTTKSIRVMGFVGTTFIGSGSTAFNFLYNFTAARKGTADEVSIDETAYQIKRTESVQFELYMLEGDDPNGNKTKLGQTATIKDLDLQNLSSDFFANSFTNSTRTKNQMDNDLTMTDYNTNSILHPSDTSASSVLTPQSFGLSSNDTRLFTDSKYMIKIVNATDYRGDGNTGSGTVSGTIDTANVMTFADGEDYVIFTITAKHTRLENPNNGFSTAYAIPKGSLSGTNLSTYGFETVGSVNVELENNTIVGYRLLPDYAIKDAIEVRYNIYKIKDDQTTIPNDQTIYYNSTILDNETQKDAKLNTNRNADADAKFTLVKTEVVPTASKEVTDYIIYFQDIPGLERGDRFFVTFEVLSDCTNEATHIDCDENHENDLYPFCTYGEEYFNQYAQVPMYRTPVLTAPKQEPKIERYPVLGASTSEMQSSAKWKYRILDPDETIPNLYITGGTAYMQLVVGNSRRNVALAGDDYTVYKDVTFTGLSDGNVYYTSIPYKRYNTSVIEENPDLLIDSDSIEFKAAKEYGASYNNVRVTESLWQGGYQVRLTLEGKDIFDMAGAKITIEGTGSDGLPHQAVYDYVPIDINNSYKDAGFTIGWGYITLSTSELVALKNAGVTEATIKVEGYMNTYEMGFKTTNDSASIYAFKQLSSDGTYQYMLYDQVRADITPIERLTMVNNAGKGSYRLASASIFNMPDGGGLDVANKSLSMDYKPTSLSYHTGVSFDRSGLTIGANHYAVERLVLKQLPIDGTYANMTISDIYPAISYLRGVPGATGEIMYFEVNGTAAVENFPVYAEVKDSAGQFLTMEIDTSPESGKKFYRVTGTSATQVLASNAIPAYKVNDKVYVDMDIRGLESNASYKVNYYTKDAHGNKISLYSMERDMAAYEYQFRTNQYVEPAVIGPTYTWSSYNNKTANLKFYVNDGDGMYMKAYWRLLDGNGVVLDDGADHNGNYISRIGEATAYPYYTANTDNTNISSFGIGINPGAAYLKLGGNYKIDIKVVSTANGEILSGGTDGWVNVSSFRVVGSSSNPNMFAMPEFNIQCNKSSNSISVFTTVANINKVVMNDKFTIILEDANGVVLQTINDVPANTRNRETKFEGLDSNTAYKVVVTADLDLDNNNASDNIYTAEYNVTTQSGADAEVSGARNADGFLYVTISNVSNFNGVAKITYSVWKDGEVVTSGYKDIDTISTIYNIDSTYRIENGEYSIEVQYHDSLGQRLGQGSGMAVIQ